MGDTILCSDKEDAKKCIDSIGGEHILDWEYLQNGKIRIYLNCSLSEIAGGEDGKTR